MTARDAILQAIRQHRPPATDLPEVPAFPTPGGDPAPRFLQALREIGGEALAVATPEAVAAALATRYPEARRTVWRTAWRAEGEALADAAPHTLADVDLLVCEGTLGVAENGAVWVSETQMGHRAAPFLTQHLALVLDRRRLVWNMHEAYARLRVDAEPFGAFIAGPSKTADIEQSLVIGAHGPRSLTVLLVGEAGEDR